MFKKFFGNKGNPQPSSDSKQQQPNPKEDAKIARQAFIHGDLPHAFFHISWALASEPMNSEWRGLLEQINANMTDLQLLIPRDRQMDYARGAALAYLYAKRGDYSTALSLMINVLEAIPDARYLPWIANWLSVPERADQLSPLALRGVLAKLIAKFPGDRIDDTPSRQRLETIFPLIQYILVKQPQDAGLITFKSSLLRKVGRYEEALVIAKEAHKTEPSSYTATMLAIAHRALGEVDQAFAMYKEALNYDPSANPIRLDIGDMLTEVGRIREGQAYYKRVLDTEKDHPWAKPHYLYFQAFLEPGGMWEKQLEVYLDNHPDDPAVQALLRRRYPYIGYLPEPSDAIINTLHQVADQFTNTKNNPRPTSGTKQNHFKMTLSSLESPSARLALDLFLMDTVKLKGTISVLNIPSPDPRLPHGAVDFVLWRYDGNDPEPAIAAPSEEVATKIARIAATPPNLGRWVYHARNLAVSLNGDRLNDLLGVMLHPPACPAGIEIWNWIHHLQVVAALTIAFLNSDEQWITSLRRRALYSLVRGPMDWTVEAALIALCYAGRDDPSIVPDVAEIWSETLDSLPTSGAIPYLEALVYCGLALPDIPEKLRVQLSAIKKQLL